MEQSNNSRTSFAIKNLITSFLLQIITVILNMITLKLFIESYGSSINGLISSITQILSYIMLVEAGLGVASIQALYRPISNNNKEEINEILSATKNFYLKSGVYFLFILMITILIYPNFVELQMNYYAICILIFIMSIPTIIDYFFQAKLRVFLTAAQKTYVINNIQIIATLLSSIIRIIFIIRGYNVMLVQLVYGIVSLIKVILLYMYINKHYKWISFKEKPNNLALNKRWSALVHQLAGLVVNGSSILIIGIFCSLEEASVYSLYNLIFSTVTNFMWIFANSVTPGFGQLLVTENLSSIKNVYNRFESLFYMFMFIIYITIYLMITPFINLYTLNINDIEYTNNIIPILFTIVNILNCLRIPANNMINASGLFENTKKQAILEAIINLIVSLICVRYIGIYGVLIGSIISFLYRSIDIIIYTNKNILKTGALNTFKRIAINLIFSIIICIFFKNIIYNMVNSWINLILALLIILILVSAIVICINYYTDKRVVKDNIYKITNIIFRFNRIRETHYE